MSEVMGCQSIYCTLDDVRNGGRVENVDTGAGNAVFEVGASEGGPEREGDGTGYSGRDRVSRFCASLLEVWRSNGTSNKGYRVIGNPKGRGMVNRRCYGLREGEHGGPPRGFQIPSCPEPHECQANVEGNEAGGVV